MRNINEMGTFFHIITSKISKEVLCVHLEGNNVKKLFVFAIAIFAALSIAICPMAGTADVISASEIEATMIIPPKIVINGESVKFNNSPIFFSERVLVPLREIAEFLGLSVKWNEADQTITCSINHLELVTMQLENNRYTIENTPYWIFPAPILFLDSTYVPVRFFSEALGAQVHWDEPSCTVQIDVPSIFDSALSEEPISLLNNRLSISMPEGSKAETQNQYPITNVISPKIMGSFISFKAEELFLDSSGDLIKDLEYWGKIPTGEIIKKERLTLIPYQYDPKAVKVYPTSVSSQKYAIQYTKKYLLCDENGMLIDLTITAAATENLQKNTQFHIFADKIIHTIRPGSQTFQNMTCTDETDANYGYYNFHLPSGGIGYKKLTSITKVQEQPYLFLYLNSDTDPLAFRPDINALEIVRKTKGSYLGNTFTWQIYSDGTMYAKIQINQNFTCILYGYAKDEKEQENLIALVNQYRLATGAKPVIYLYPEEETEVTVKLDLSGDFTFTYPAYQDGWTVTAKPDGTILSGGNTYSYLFWEGTLPGFVPDFKEGFVIKGSESAEFLQKTLSAMGLTPREYNEFIVYWAPKMQENEYNKVYFAQEEYEQVAKLQISPSPDSLLRVFMVFEATAPGTTLPPQKIKPFVRKGFTVVEWGGCMTQK